MSAEIPSEGIHPCATPDHPRKNGLDGDMWACRCGRVYVRRLLRTWAGDTWFWNPTDLIANEGKS